MEDLKMELSQRSTAVLLPAYLLVLTSQTEVGNSLNLLRLLVGFFLDLLPVVVTANYSERWWSSCASSTVPYS